MFFRNRSERAVGEETARLWRWVLNLYKSHALRWRLRVPRTLLESGTHAYAFSENWFLYEAGGKPTNNQSDGPRRLLEQQLEEIRKAGQATSACLIVFGTQRAQVMGAAACSVADLDRLRNWKPHLPAPAGWRHLEEKRGDLRLVLCLKQGNIEEIEKMARAYLLRWLATLVYADPGDF